MSTEDFPNFHGWIWKGDLAGYQLILDENGLILAHHCGCHIACEPAITMIALIPQIMAHNAVNCTTSTLEVPEWPASEQAEEAEHDK